CACDQGRRTRRAGGPAAGPGSNRSGSAAAGSGAGPPADTRTRSGPLRAQLDAGAQPVPRTGGLQQADTGPLILARALPGPPVPPTTRVPMPSEVVNPANVFNTRQYGFSQAVLVQGGRRMLLSGQVG